MTVRLPAWLLGLIVLGSAAPLAAQGVDGPGSPLPVPGGTNPSEAPAGGVRRPQGVPPGTTNAQNTTANAPAPAPRALTPAELEELRKRMVGGTRDTILKPGEISDIRRSVQEAQGAGVFPGRDGRMPRPEPRTLTVSEQTSVSAPETLHLAYGVVSPITFVDAKGRPWPIASVAYDPRLFAQDGVGCGQDTAMGSTQVATASGSDRPTSINLMPCRFDTWGNILIRLEGFAYPIPVMVLSGAGERVDIPVTVLVAGTSPLLPARAEAGPARPARPKGPPAPRGEPGPDGTQLLHLFAAGTPPRGALPLVATSGAQAWIYRERMYVRLDGTLLSPQPVGSADGPGGTKVYEFLRPASRLMAERADGTEVAVAVEF
ncbi:DotH/IcmK family type IV secretion protein [Methylorubrum thiocyanatum]|uniref:DotH/IcmK family type IV secretion protein n=1 Tax=Methylorubrum thiocyanatum TaxID=47958 RepID=UPI003F7CD461